MTKDPSQISLIAHELQAPLALLKSRLEQALHADWCRGEGQDLLQQCLAEVESMNRLIVDLLLLERTDAGELARSRQHFDMAELTRTVCDGFESLATSRGIRFDFTLSGPLPVMGDESQLKRVLANLLDNAFKYTAPGSQVRLEGCSAGGMVAVEVRDKGCGIPCEAIPHIFERFYQVDRARDREAGGIGMGLSIVRALVDQNGGTIEVESAPGQGSCFTVKLPLKS
jgi:signal transduction histidine kinase